AKHRVFQFLDAAILPDNKLIAIASSDAAHLALLSSHAHRLWYLANSGRIGVYDQDAVYVKSRCFDPFPFPDLTDAARARLAVAAEEMDALRKRVLAQHPDLTLTGLYNVLEAVRAGAPLSDRDASVRDRGLVLILRDLHDDIDRAVTEAYGWPADLEAAQIVARLAALNIERARDEGAGRVRWLRPDFQRPRLAVAGRAGDLALPEVAAPQRA
ncbi:MAG: class I SAM-dependent DNA methyltransferase, partial [Brevundimonas sp.]